MDCVQAASYMTADVEEVLAKLRRNPRGIAFEFEHEVADILEFHWKDAKAYKRSALDWEEDTRQLRRDRAQLFVALNPFAKISADDGDNFAELPPQTIIRTEVTANNLQVAREAIANTVDRVAPQMLPTK